ncbi:uncharacterized protein LOC114916885 [Cajanus cajan]|uniref:uncharacterized protein LOC114916885 n=1 Tax=Cajanus cajan TaxID=3821 RepID=UPI0010FB3CA6|nr:uncharacterized protein LOC114916885 [Cajanus cajan]
MEEVTSKAADADVVDLTGTSEQDVPYAEVGVAAEVEILDAEQVAQAAKEGGTVETPVPPRSEVPDVGPPVAKRGTPAYAFVTTRGKEPSSEVFSATPAVSAPSSGPSQGASQSRYIAHRFGKLVREDDVEDSSNENASARPIL